jgi:hypothetical protein
MDMENFPDTNSPIKTNISGIILTVENLIRD